MRRANLSRRLGSVALVAIVSTAAAAIVPSAASALTVTPGTYAGTVSVPPSNGFVVAPSHWTLDVSETGDVTGSFPLSFTLDQTTSGTGVVCVIKGRGATVVTMSGHMGPAGVAVVTMTALGAHHVSGVEHCHYDATTTLGFNRSKQHWLVHLIVEEHRVPPPESSNRASFADVR